MAYNPRKFLDNVNKLVQQKEEEQKKIEIGKIVSSLQKPAQDVITALIAEQHTRVEALLKSIGWRK